MIDVTLIKTISTLAILIPIYFNARVLRTAGINFRLFFAFLLIGFSIDLTGWYAHSHGAGLNTTFLIVSHLYAVIEAVFFVWISMAYVANKMIHRLRGVLFGLIAIWATYVFLAHIYLEAHIRYSDVFDTFYEVVVSFIAGFALLNLAEKEEEMTRLPELWLLAGIFFYCFSTFFIFIVNKLLSMDVSNHLWLVHNVANIVAYIFYSIGFWRAKTT